MRKSLMKFSCCILFFGIQTLGFSESDGCEKKVALVAGSAGFIGSHMCEYLLNKGYEVIGIDNLYTGSLDNIESFQRDPHFHFIEHDITKPIEIQTHLDEIYNFACPASPVHYQKDPIFTLKTSVLGAIHLLDLAMQHGAKIFQSSTSEVYGDPKEHPQKESYWGNVNPFGIRSCYDEGKRCAETLFFDYHRQHDVKIKVGRIFNTYGPRMGSGDGRVVPNFITQALSHESITVYGSGEQTRSFCFVSDLIEGIYRLMQTGDDVTGPVNMGNPLEFTMNELASIVIQLTNSRSAVVFKKLPLDDPQQRRPDISFAKKIIDWEPQVALEEGLIETIAYFSNQSNQTVSLNTH